MNRRGFLLGLLAAPVIVRAGSLMPVKASPLMVPVYEWAPVTKFFTITGYNEMGEIIQERIEWAGAMTIATDPYADARRAA